MLNKLNSSWSWSNNVAPKVLDLTKIFNCTCWLILLWWLSWCWTTGGLWKEDTSLWLDVQVVKSESSWRVIEAISEPFNQSGRVSMIIPTIKYSDECRDAWCEHGNVDLPQVGFGFDWTLSDNWVTLEWTLWYEYSWLFVEWIISYITKLGNQWIFISAKKAPKLAKYLANFGFTIWENWLITAWWAILKKDTDFNFNHWVWSREVGITQRTFEVSYSHFNLLKLLYELKTRWIYHVTDWEDLWKLWEETLTTDSSTDINEIYWSIKWWKKFILDLEGIFKTSENLRLILRWWVERDKWDNITWWDTWVTTWVWVTYRPNDFTDLSWDYSYSQNWENSYWVGFNRRIGDWVDFFVRLANSWYDDRIMTWITWTFWWPVKSYRKTSLPKLFPNSWTNSRITHEGLRPDNLWIWTDSLRSPFSNWTNFSTQAVNNVNSVNNIPTWEDIIINAEFASTAYVDLANYISDLDSNDNLVANIVWSWVLLWDPNISSATIVWNIATLTVSGWSWEWYIDYTINDWTTTSQIYRITFQKIDGE